MKIQIICSKPGKRRSGKTHPASAFYQDGDWTADEIAAFEADPDFVIREVGDDENFTTLDDFRIAVDQEVKRLLDIEKDKLQATFDQALKEAVANKTASLKSEYDNALDAAGKDLADANARIEALEKELAAATPPAKKTTAK